MFSMIVLMPVNEIYFALFSKTSPLVNIAITLIASFANWLNFLNMY